MYQTPEAEKLSGLENVIIFPFCFGKTNLWKYDHLKIYERQTSGFIHESYCSVEAGTYLKIENHINNELNHSIQI